MKALYTLTVRPSVRIPAGELHLNVGGTRTFYFATVEERQPILDWARTQGWKHSTNIEHVQTADEVRAEILRDIEAACAHLHHPVPAELKG